MEYSSFFRSVICLGCIGLMQCSHEVFSPEFNADELRQASGVVAAPLVTDVKALHKVIAAGRPYTPHGVVRPGDHTLGFLSKPHTDVHSYNAGRLPFTHQLSLRFDYVARYFIFYVDILNIDTLFYKRVLTYNPNQSIKQGSLLVNEDLTLRNGAVINAFTLVAPLFGFEIKF